MRKEEEYELFKMPEVKPQPLDIILNRSYINALRKHIELLENKKREIENEYMLKDFPNVCKGYILGLNYAIQQLECDIKYYMDNNNP